MLAPRDEPTADVLGFLSIPYRDVLAMLAKHGGLHPGLARAHRLLLRFYLFRKGSGSLFLAERIGVEAGGDCDDSKQQNGDKPDDKKDGSKNPQPQGQAKNGEQKKDGEKGAQPKPSPDEPNKKLAGDIKPQNGQQPQPQPDAQQQEAEEAQAAAEGKMTEAQAKGLLDSLKGEDTKVQLLKPGERRAGGRVLKDW